MKITIKNTCFAECMRKIQAAVSQAKEKKGVKEGIIQINVTRNKMGENYIGMAIAFDGKKQLLSTFIIDEIEMEEESYNLYLNGKRICDISNVFMNGKEESLFIDINKNCVIKKGGSQVQVPIGESPVIIQPSNDVLCRAVIKTKDLADLINRAGRFYIASSDNVLNSVCIKYDIENNQLKMSSSDGYKISYIEKAAEYENIALEEGTTELTHLIEGEELKIISKFLEYETTELLIYKKSLYLKSGSDVAIFLTKDSEDESYPLNEILQLSDQHSRKQKIELLPDSIIEALNVFDVVNQEVHPFVHITRQTNGMLCFQTKGKTGKTVVEAIVDEEFKELALHAKILRQVIGNFDKDKKMIIYVGENQEQVLLKQKEKSNDFALIVKIEQDA